MHVTGNYMHVVVNMHVTGMYIAYLISVSLTCMLVGSTPTGVDQYRSFELLYKRSNSVPVR